MPKPHISNQRKANIEHKKRTERYVALIQQVYDRIANEAARRAVITGYDPNKPFSFADYPETAEAIKQLQAEFVGDVGAIIMAGTSAEWKESNLVQDLVAKKVLTAYTGTSKSGEEFERYYETNPDSLKAFQQRCENGLKLSDRVWNLSEQYKAELETAIESAIAPGVSAQQLSQNVRKFLNEPDLMFRRFRYKDGAGRWRKKWKKRITDEDGNVRFIDCDKDSYRNQWTGPGYYKSSYKNAMRLARTEINIAYRTAEQKRWEQFDFVVGYEVKTTQNGKHVTDICDDLAGKYPKSFHFTGWHPACMCYCIPILKTEDEFWLLDDDAPSKNEVMDVPQGFKDWVKDNQERIERAAERGKLPYFLRDNPDEVNKILYPEKVAEIPASAPLSIQERAAIRHANRTQEDIDAIQDRWNSSRMENFYIQAERIGGYKVSEICDLASLLDDDKALSDHEAFKNDYKLAMDFIRKRIKDETLFAEKFLEDDDNLAQIEEFAKALGIKRSRPMTYYEADYGKENPNYGQLGYGVNCQTCTLTHWLRRLGLDIEARPNIEGTEYDVFENLKSMGIEWNQRLVDKNGSTPDYNFTYLWKQRKGYVNMSEKRVKEYINEQILEDGIYEIYNKWANSSSAHVFLAEKRGGIIRFTDPQSSIQDAEDYFKHMDKSMIGIIRIDDKRFNPKLDAKKLFKAK